MACIVGLPNNNRSEMFVDLLPLCLRNVLANTVLFKTSLAYSDPRSIFKLAIVNAALLVATVLFFYFYMFYVVSVVTPLSRGSWEGECESEWGRIEGEIKTESKLKKKKKE